MLTELLKLSLMLTELLMLSLIDTELLRLSLMLTELLKLSLMLTELLKLSLMLTELLKLPNYHPIFGCVVLILVLDHQSFSSIVVSFTLCKGTPKRFTSQDALRQRIMRIWLFSLRRAAGM